MLKLFKACPATPYKQSAHRQSTEVQQVNAMAPQSLKRKQVCECNS